MKKGFPIYSVGQHLQLTKECILMAHALVLLSKNQIPKNRIQVRNELLPFTIGATRVVQSKSHNSSSQFCWNGAWTLLEGNQLLQITVSLHNGGTSNHLWLYGTQNANVFCYGLIKISLNLPIISQWALIRKGQEEIFKTGDKLYVSNGHFPRWKVRLSRLTVWATPIV